MKTVLLFVFIFILIDLDWVEILVADTDIAKYTTACQELAKCIKGTAIVHPLDDDYVCELNRGNRREFLETKDYFKLEIKQCPKFAEEESEYEANQETQVEVNTETDIDEEDL